MVSSRRGAARGVLRKAAAASGGAPSDRSQVEKYADYLALGIEEWKKSYGEHQRLGKKAVLFVMVDDTRNCDDVGAHLQRVCSDLQGAVLVIHTKKNGEIAEAATGKDKEELEALRREANRIDGSASPCKAIVSVLMPGRWSQCGRVLHAPDPARSQAGRRLRGAHLAVGFKPDCVKADGDLSTYTPDFIVKAADGSVLVVETKGREELDLPRKMARLAQWCADATAASQAAGGPR